MDIKQKVSKLLALSKSANAHEAAAALAKAERLMQEYEIERSAIPGDYDAYKTLTTDIVEVKWNQKIRFQKWHSVLSVAVASLQGVVSYTCGPDVWFYGNEARAMVAASMLDYLIQAGNREWKQELKNLAGLSSGHKQQLRKSFLIGFSRGVFANVKKIRDDETGEGLVHVSTVDRAREDLKSRLDLVSSRSRSTRVDSTYYNQGFEKGVNTGVNSQVTSGNKQLMGV